MNEQTLPADVKFLKELVQSLRGKIDSLQYTNDQLAGTFETERSGLLARIATLEAQLPPAEGNAQPAQLTHNAFNQMFEERNAARTELDHALSQLATKDGEYQSLLIERDNLQTQLNNVQLQFRDEYGNLRDHAVASTAALQSQLDACAKCCSECSQHKARLEDVANDEIGRLTRDTQRLVSERDAANQLNALLGKQAQQLQQEKDAMAKDLSSANANRVDLKMEKQDLQREKNALAEDLAAANVEIANLGVQMQDLQQEKDAMAKDLSSANANRVDLKMEKQDLQREKNALAEDLAAANVEIANLGVQMQDLQQEKDTMAKDLSSANAEKAHLNGEIFSITWKLKDVTKERDAAVKLNARNRGTIVRKNEEITRLSNNMAAAIDEKDTMAKELASAKEKNARLQESLANKQSAGDGDGSGKSPECLHLDACGMSLSVTEREWSW